MGASKINSQREPAVHSNLQMTRFIYLFVIYSPHISSHELKGLVFLLPTQDHILLASYTSPLRRTQKGTLLCLTLYVITCVLLLHIIKLSLAYDDPMHRMSCPLPLFDVPN